MSRPDELSSLALSELSSDIGKERVIWLFDIDGTLIRSGGAGGLAMGRALEEAFDVPPDTRGVCFSGRTDRGITLDLFAAHEIEATQQNFELFYETYLSKLSEALEERDGVVLPGAVELLNLVSGGSGQAALGLLTGNMQAAAKRKLEHFGLWDYFSFGGYGDVDANRDDVAGRAIEAVAQYLNRPVEPKHAWVIGDTPNDIQCARAHGMKVICLPTGECDEENLLSHCPDILLKSLHELAKIARLTA